MSLLVSFLLRMDHRPVSRPYLISLNIQIPSHYTM